MNERKFLRQLKHIEGYCGHPLWRTRSARKFKLPQVDLLDAMLQDSQTLIDIANEAETMITKLIAAVQTEHTKGGE